MPRSAVHYRSLFLATLAFAALISLVLFVFLIQKLGFGEPHYLMLAGSFLKARLDLPVDFVNSIGPLDMVVRDGRYYWPLGPLPAVLFMPFVAAFGPVMTIESVAHCAAALAAAVLAYALARRKGFPSGDAAWLAAAFCLGSVIIGLSFTNGPWFFENLLSAVLLLAALVERSGKNRPIIIGLCVALAGACRLPALVAGVFFFLRDFMERRPWKDALRRMAAMAAPVALALLALGAYDAARFGDPLWTGQRDHVLQDPAYAESRDKYGVFNPVNIPRNFAVYFLRLPSHLGYLPLVEPRGVSVFLISPVFLWVLAARPKDPDVIAAAICSAALLAVLLSYFTDGSWQFGPRYLADLAPFWYLVLLGVFRKRGFGILQRAAIGASAIANMALFWIFEFHFVFHVI
ncbi:MAG: hypothetical protein RL272_871 [Candidatus Parcubacteria bacterium]|jgi:hypothetical protein